MRSSSVVSDVLGTLEPGLLVEMLEKKCGAGLLKVDASSKLGTDEGRDCGRMVDSD